MIRRILPLMLLLHGLSGSAQVLDSLEQRWRNTNLSWPARLEAMSEYCWELRQQDPPGRTRMSKHYLEMATRYGTATDVGDAWNQLGMSYSDASLIDSALFAYDHAFAWFEGAPAQQGSVLANRGAELTNMGAHEEAIRCLLEAIKLYEQGGHPADAMPAYGNLGILFVYRKEYVKAISAFRKGHDLCMAQDDLLQAAHFLGDIGTVYSEAGDLHKALQYLTEAEELLIAIGAPLNLELHDNIGTLYRRMGRLDEAEERYQRALAGHLNEGSRGSLVSTLINLGGLALVRKQQGEALRYCDEALRMADQLGLLIQQQHACECLYQAHEASGNGTVALHYHKRMVAAKDSLVNEENIKGITRLEMQFEFTKQKLADSLQHSAELAQLENERTIAQLRADRNRNRALATGGGGLLLLLGGTLWYRADRKRRQERFEREAAQLETQALRSQMNPHFIFNALNSINAYVQQNDQDSASSYLTKFAKVMRAVLENSRHTEVSLSEDLDALRGYMELERMRMQRKFDFDIQVATDIDPEEVMVPPLVVQPFVENAIWHGMRGKDGQGHITLKVERRGEQLVWIIEDDGVGRAAPKPEPTGATPDDAPAKKTSLGTAITRARLDLVQKQHGGKAGFRYVDLPQGTRVEVDMPVVMA